MEYQIKHLYSTICHINSKENPQRNGVEILQVTADNFIDTSLHISLVNTIDFVTKERVELCLTLKQKKNYLNFTLLYLLFSSDLDEIKIVPHHKH